MLKKILCAILLSFLLVLTGVESFPVEARKKYRKRTRRKRRIRKRRRTRKRKKRKIKRRRVRKPVPTIIHQVYRIKEKIRQADTDVLAKYIKEYGVDKVSIDIDNNTVLVDYNTKNSNAIEIISAIKAAGYSIERIN